MNGLFTLIWLADLVIAFKIVMAIGIGYGVHNFLRAGKSKRLSHISLDEYNKGPRKIVIRMGVLVFVCVVGMTLIPSRNTILIYAGAKTTQAAFQTELGQKAVNALNVELDKIIKDK